MIRGGASAAGALLLALAFGGSAQAEVHARVVPSLRAGAGWSSDLFLGARLGSSAEGQLAPALRLDLSLAPRLKLWTEYRFAFGLYEVTRSTALDHGLEVGALVRLARRLSAQLAAEVRVQSLSVAQALDDQIGLEASESLGASLAPSLRYRAERLELEALYSHEQVRHTLDGGEIVAGRLHLGALTCSAALGPLWTSISARYLREQTSIRQFSYWGASLHGSAALAPFPPLVVRLVASAHRNDFEAGRLDTLLKAGLVPSLRLTEVLWLEAAYGFASNSSDSAHFDATRHFVYLGLRAGGELWRR